MMMVALDVASRTGVAVGAIGSTPQAWSVHLGKTDDERYANALKLTDKLIRDYRPDMVAIEAPVGGPKTSHLLVGLVACIRGACKARGVPAQSVNIASCRKHFVGGHVTSAAYQHLPANKRKAKAREDNKVAVMNRCKALGWRVADDDAADACAIWDYACSQQSPAHAVFSVGGLFR